ncbi:acyl-CoA synthetase [Nocardia carnea]|uniref:acyl-CoA synthetase n=1 Tax=Nocardia carnea TaxID=37328 RepID=UPI0024589A9B|nr:long-chain fatty acid--CoA ligase [Nocardia carnea]
MFLTEGLHRAVTLRPDLPATVHRGRIRTWAESAERVARLAGAFRSLGVRRGDRIAMLAANSDCYHEYLLATPWADAVLNPVNTRWSAAEIAYSLADSETRILIVDDAFTGMVPPLTDRYGEIHTVIHAGDGPVPDGMLSFDELIDAHAPIDDARRGGDRMAGIFYTGGTTGAPKGVMLSHDNLLVSASGFIACGDTITPGGRLLHVAPMFHLADIGAWVSRNLIGGTHIMEETFDPAIVVATVERHQVTDLLLVPTMLQMLVDHPATVPAALTSIQHLIYGASPISEALLDRVEQTMPRARPVQAYGMTELAPVASVLSGTDHADPSLRRSAGRAAPHVELRIVDIEGAAVENGVVGEIAARGGNVMLGYWNRPAETEKVLREGWFHTGDGGYLDDRGYLFIVDRLKDMIVTGGENVYSAEVENALAKHPAVASCAVIGVPDDEWGERVHAFVVLARGEQTSVEDLRTHCRSEIAGYKTPRTIDFLEALPLSGAGKILKRDLRARYWGEAERAVH